VTSPDAPEQRFPTNEQKLNLLTIFAGQFDSYATMVWQVPALSLTAQSFLLTIALTHGNSPGAKYISAGLSIGIAFASVQLMHGQRAHQICHGELASRLAHQLQLARHMGGPITDSDSGPERLPTWIARSQPRGDAVSVWKAVDHWIYHTWNSLMVLFAVADGVIIVNTILGASWLK
jgi:hypothetical protein